MVKTHLTSFPRSFVYYTTCSMFMLLFAFDYFLREETISNRITEYKALVV